MQATLLFAIAPRAFELDLAVSPSRARFVNVAALLGTVLALGSLAVSARTGVLAQQLRDTSGFASTLLVVRLCGEALLFTALVLIVRGALREPPGRPPATPPV